MTGAAMHACTWCAKLPEAERPKRPRPAPHGGPRSRRCTTHERAWRTARRDGARARRSLTVYGLAPGRFAALKAFQGGVCAICCRATGASRELAHDHDHELARAHEHPEDRACEGCMRGALCSTCNEIIIGRYSDEALRRAIAYRADPPMQQLRRWEAEQEARSQ